MKHQTEKRSEVGMRFFTPELYLRFNSANDGDADQANEQWEEAIQAYHRDLASFREQMPPAVQKLAGSCLHDAELLEADDGIDALPAWPLGPYWTAYRMSLLRRGEQGIVLMYQLWDVVRQHPAGDIWPFSKQQVHWLFDEVGAEPGSPRTFWHRVLLSDGRVTEIPFTNVLVRTFSWRSAEAVRG